MTLREFIDAHVQIIEPIYAAIADTYRQASISGKTEDYLACENAQHLYNNIYANKQEFALLQQLAKEESNRTPFLKREYDRLYLYYLSSQGNKEILDKIVSLETQVEEKFSTYRAIYNGKEYTDNDVEKILKTSRDSTELQGIREAHKAVGTHVAEDVIQLARLRNQYAQSLGFKNFHVMNLFLNEMEQSELDTFFDQLAIKTKDIFAQHKQLLDKHLAEYYGCSIAELKPWHYQNRYFQEVPQSFGEKKIDSYYENQDIEQLTIRFYTGIGLDIDDILTRSDLYEKPGKAHHAFSSDNKVGGIRVLCNIQPNECRMGTILHEFGHALYDKHLNPALPYIIREQAHQCTTEAVAEFFQDLSGDANWMQAMLLISEEEKNKIQTSLSYMTAFLKLIFAQRAQVIRRFEKALYEDPDQDLNKRWRDLVSEYQLLTPPAGRNSPDRATKVHIATTPCYYHNYIIGYVLAQQRREKMEEIAPGVPSLVDQKQVGQRFKETIFAPGASVTWRELVRNSTGEDLNVDIFVNAIKQKMSSYKG